MKEEKGPNASVICLIKEFWRLLRLFDAGLTYHPPAKQNQIRAQYRFIKRKYENLLKELQVEIIVYDGQPYSAELPVIVVNSEEVPGAGDCRIQQTLSPGILSRGKLVEKGQVVLARSK